jgi:hypothetical protein
VQGQGIEFGDVAQVLEDCLLWLIQSRARREGGAPPQGLITNEETIEEAIRLLYDYTHDPTWIPHWISQMEFINSRIQRDNPPGAMLGELKNRIEFLNWRIAQTLRPAEQSLGIRQQWELNRLKGMLAACKEGKAFAEPEPPSFAVNWELLAPSGDGWQQIVAYIESLEEFKHTKRDENRLAFLYEEKPDMRFVGTSGFRGYIGFIFHRSKHVILENPFVGNALYALPSEEWRELSKLSKTELLDRPDVERVIHPDDKCKWPRKLQRCLSRWGV